MINKKLEVGDKLRLISECCLLSDDINVGDVCVIKDTRDEGNIGLYFECLNTTDYTLYREYNYSNQVLNYDRMMKNFELVEEAEPKVRIVEELYRTFIIIENKYTICIPNNSQYGIAIKKDSEEYNEEIGKALAYYRK
jgi:hypothetical protein